MNVDELRGPLHGRNKMVEEAIRDVVHDLACHCHAGRIHERIEIQTRRVSREVTDEASGGDARTG